MYLTETIQYNQIRRSIKLAQIKLSMEKNTKRKIKYLDKLLTELEVAYMDNRSLSFVQQDFEQFEQNNYTVAS